MHRTAVILRRYVTFGNVAYVPLAELKLANVWTYKAAIRAVADSISTEQGISRLDLYVRSDDSYNGVEYRAIF